MVNMLERIFENWKTTAIGGLIIIGCFAAVIMGEATLEEVSFTLPVVLGLFFIKDKLKK